MKIEQVNKEVGVRLQKFRKSYGVSVPELATLSGITKRTIYRLESSESKYGPSLVVLVLLLDSMNVSLEQFFEDI